MFHLVAKYSSDFMCDLICYVDIHIAALPPYSQNFWNEARLPWEHHPTMRFLSPIFLWCFQMAQIMVTIEMVVALVYDFVTNKVNLVVLDQTLIVTFINDQQYRAFLFLCIQAMYFVMVLI